MQNISNNQEILKLQHAFYASWSKETAFHTVEKEWSNSNKAIGQCTVTSIIVKEFLGGVMKRGFVPSKNFYHYWNVLDDNQVVDLTKSQFETEVEIEKITTKSQNQLLKMSSVNSRYIILKERVTNFLNELEKIENEINTCRKCNFVENFNFKSIYFGSDCNLLFVGEAPAKNGWRITGKAWRNEEGKIIPTGNNLAKLLKIINLELDDITFLEAIKCFPPSRNDLPTAITNCKNFLERQINLLNPVLIVPLGEWATKSILGSETKFSETVGKFHKISIFNKSFDVMPVYHPSPVSPKAYQGNVPIFESINTFLEKITRPIPKKKIIQGDLFTSQLGANDKK